MALCTLTERDQGTRYCLLYPSALFRIHRVPDKNPSTMTGDKIIKMISPTLKLAELATPAVLIEATMAPASATSNM